MLRLSLRGLSAVLGGLVLSSTVGAGIASADPDLDLAINTTCS
ncbi:low molecular weight t-cell antigen tb8.4 [Mycobacteroides abscessus subsp. abscessus]|nr:low molecular weight T-cell antigen [Mycobacteroides abscessus subsp. abscessus]SHZ88077.1 low molecular weight T-cell antigen [Mycobacteroides abscessus subsp. abscessus]SHZ92172.1 low molecular weight T-cell antigen [Mycobacteroides abscessus subsp. abscessus]SIF65634.1 low molecular weight t-cell antigen tb8.4 [Mycobacteroides abscessus subsp. abscessus]SIG42013.1 low molecular weight t-cell antigen tb8.4 [Mycobacteroides abscessus subsp. abscessus]